VPTQPFYGGFGLIAAGGIPKPAFNAFKLLHQLGEERLDLDSDHALLTRRRDGTLVLAVWNYVEPGSNGVLRASTLKLPEGARSARLTRLDTDHGDVAHEYARMGSPQFPTPAQIEALVKASALSPPEELGINAGSATVSLLPSALAVIEIAMPPPAPTAAPAK
jgi:xylan 1,4-beta-xylosidase